MDTTIQSQKNIDKELAEAIYLNLHALAKFDKPRKEYLVYFASATAVVSYTNLFFILQQLSISKTIIHRI